MRITCGKMFAFQPLWGYVATKLGYRGVGCFGAFVCALGLFTSSCSPSLFWMFVTYGFVMPFGVSAVGILADATPPQWFLKVRHMLTLF
jgi:MFS family permease